MRYSQMIMLVMLSCASVLAQTQVDQTQIKNITTSPVASVERWQCSGTCDGLSMIRLILTDGTIVGPFIGITASAPQQSNPRWVRVPLNNPTPPVPSVSLQKKQ